MGVRIADGSSRAYWTAKPEGDIIEGEFTVVTSPMWALSALTDATEPHPPAPVDPA